MTSSNELHTNWKLWEGEESTDLIQDVRRGFTTDESDNSTAFVEVAIDNSSAFVVYETSSDISAGACAIALAKDDRGTSYFATCLAYIILRERAEGNLSACYAGMISYVPPVSPARSTVFLEPGNAWAKDTVGMVSYHVFNDSQNVPNLSDLSNVAAINQALISVAGSTHDFPSWKKFLLGYNILSRLSKTIDSLRLTVDNGILHDDCCPFDVSSDWTKLIRVLIFHEDASGLSCDIERAVGFEHRFLQTTYDSFDTWDNDINRHALITTIVWKYRDSMKESFDFYMDLMYNIIERIEDNVIRCERLKSFLLSCRPDLQAEKLEGRYEPLGASPIRHNAGDFLVDVPVSSPGTVSGIRYEPGLQPMLMPSFEFKFNIRQPRLRAVMKIIGDEITLESRQLRKLAIDYQGRVTGFSILGNGISRQYVPRLDILKGSMVANIALSGTMGPAVGIWVLSHIIFGDLTVSKSSLACYAKILAVPDGKLMISTPLSPDISRSIHTVTDGDHIFTVLHPNVMFQLNEHFGEWHATKLEHMVENENLKSCFIVSNRHIGGRGSAH